MSQASISAPGKSGSRLSDSLPDDTLLGWLRSMQLIREFETRTMQAYQQAKIGGFCHIYTGEEASAVGTFACAKPTDPVVLAYRDHGHALARGMDPKVCMAEMFGKAAGCAKGKGGSMHMFDKPHWLFGGHGIVGAQTPLGAGLAFAARYEWDVLGTGEKKICLCYLGDGAVDQGAFSEALNLVALYSLPVIYIIENNGYSMGTAIKRHSANAEHLIERGKAFGINAVEIDGLDIRNLYDQFKPIADECRDLQRPAFIDLKTYRYQGHSMSDPQKYRTKDEVDRYKKKDSIANLLHHLMTERNCIDEAGWKAMRKELSAEVKEAVEFAEQAPKPDPSELFTDVYTNPQPNLSPSAVYHHGEKNPLL
ncbi:MAG TPA: pyruvate dehydrogenase (acetyl-transferring) E1 component subunit alpha [Phycisphaerales bacterium]|nr:pyruvate dehydrogenase (acetyl-transferring) E1 component subunit alpha [Phycisphaerales bacterium]